MKNNSFEKLNNGVWKRIVIGSTYFVAVLFAGIFVTSQIKQELVENINIANSTAKYDAIDSNMIAMYTSEDGINYTEITDRMPDGSEYIINEEKSYCNISGVKDDNAILKTVDGNHIISNLIKGDKCYLYFDKYTPPITIPNIIATNNPKTTTPNFGTATTTDEGVFQVADGMYGGTSYYWRGAVTNNYVKFANFCWRIVRINGDGSIRLIYDGTTCHANGQSTTESIAVSNVAYNSSYTLSNCVGWTYTGTSQRTLSGTASNAKIQLESWYKANITDKEYGGKVASGKYCNDRDAQSGNTWTPTGGSFNYAAYKRIYTDRQPTLSCPSGDTYTLNAGLITADEVMYAGGLNTNNSSYYLYNGQKYWTMSPNQWYTFYGYACVFFVNENGYLNNYLDGSITAGHVGNAYGIRPVINLRSDIQIKAGTDGTLNNPYEVL